MSSLGPYRLLERLAMGGMGEIWLARHRRRTEPVVVKRLLDHLRDDQDLVTLFLDEAHIASGLNHPNIARIHELGEAEGHYYLVMELVHGKSLLEVLQHATDIGHDMPVALIARVLADTAGALDFAHHATTPAGLPMHLIHRDVSPQNIMLGFNGSVKLIDFGVAKASNKQARTATGAIRGKHAYMSPEQAYGKPLDARSDVFGLGVVLWEALCGERLFRRESPIDTLKAVVGAEVPTPSKKAKRVPKALDEVVLKALQRDRERRFASAAEFKSALEGFLKTARLPASNAHLKAFVCGLYPADAAIDFNAITSESDIGDEPSITLPRTVPKLRSTLDRAPLEQLLTELPDTSQTSGALFNALSRAVLKSLGPAVEARVRRVAAHPKPYVDALTYPTSDFVRLMWKAADYALVDQTHPPPSSGAQAFFQLGFGIGRALLDSRTAEALMALTGAGPHTFIEPFLLTLATMVTPGLRTMTRATPKHATIRLTDDVMPAELLFGLVAGLSEGLHGVALKGSVTRDSPRQTTLELSW